MTRGKHSPMAIGPKRERTILGGIAALNLPLLRLPVYSSTLRRHSASRTR
jgi:hypothetical protein